MPQIPYRTGTLARSGWPIGGYVTTGLPVPVGRQHDVVYMPASGHHVVLGTAGTGKTTMALHRALHLASPTTVNGGRTLLVSFTKSLVGYMRTAIGPGHPMITVETYHTFARGYLQAHGLMSPNCITDRAQHRLVRDAHDDTVQKLGRTQFLGRPLNFFIDELEWIDGQGIDGIAAYLAAKRVGRTAPLQDPQRLAVWELRSSYLSRRASAGFQYDWCSLAGAVLSAAGSSVLPRRYKHVVIDEAQDLSPQAIRALVRIVDPSGSITLFGDYAQQIYGQRLSWQSVGLAVSKVEPFVDNYRNTREIARLAIAMSNLAYFKDSVDLVEPKEPARAAGGRPVLFPCPTRADEVSTIRSAISGTGKTDRVAVLTRSRAEAREIVKGVPGVKMLFEDQFDDRTGPGLYAGTYHSAKGLEFDTVYLPFCGEARLPDSDVVSAFGAAEALSREGRLLYVAITRARRELAITFSGAATKLLPTDPRLYA